MPPEDDFGDMMDEIINSGKEKDFMDIMEGMMDFLEAKEQRQRKKKPRKKSLPQDMLF
jgi:hypothetical protein